MQPARRYLIGSLTIGILLCYSIGLWSIQNLLLADFFPKEKPDIGDVETPYHARKRELYLQFFGIDINSGRFGILQMFGRPERAFILPPFWPPESRKPINVSHYTYPGMKLRFWNDVLDEVDITSSQWVFPIGIRVGDPEQRVYDLLGDLRNRGETGYSYRHITPGILQLNYYFGSVVSQRYSNRFS